MLAIILWIIVLIIWIVNLIIRTRPSVKNTVGNGFHILMAVLFIILAIVNIVGRVINESEKQQKTEVINTNENYDDLMYVTEDEI